MAAHPNPAHMRSSSHCTAQASRFSRSALHEENFQKTGLAIFLRDSVSQGDAWAGASWRWTLAAVLAATIAWAVLFALKMALGFALKRAAASYVAYFDSLNRGR